MKIGEALRTQASSLYSATPIGAPTHPAPIGVADQTRKKNILAHRSTGPQSRQSARLSLQSSELGPQPLNPQVSVSPHPSVPGGTHLLAGERVGGAPILADRQKKFKKRRAEHFGAPRLFSSQSPINWALQTGNGNTLKKRRRQH